MLRIDVVNVWLIALEGYVESRTTPTVAVHNGKENWPEWRVLKLRLQQMYRHSATGEVTLNVCERKFAAQISADDIVESVQDGVGLPAIPPKQLGFMEIRDYQNAVLFAGNRIVEEK